MKSSRLRVTAAASCLFILFTLLGAVFIPYIGAQYDEVLFVNAIYAPETVESSVKTRIGMIPLMLMTYLGTLKAGLFAVLLHFFPANNWTLRLPPLLLGAASVVLFFLAMRRMVGGSAAWLAALLLATDAGYLLTSVFDWGPVALQHFLFTGALYCGVRYAQERALRWLGLAMFLCGVELWDKAVSLWVFGGLGVALLLVFPRPIWELIRNRKALAVAAACFVLGASPFLYYNKIHKLRTFTANIETDKGDPLRKVEMLDYTLNGGGLFGYLVRENPEGPPQRLKSWEKAPLALAARLRAPRGSLQSVILVGALILLPLVCFGPYRAPALWAAIGGTIAFLLMINTAGAGGAMHHTILLWPLPQWVLACVLGDLQIRWPKRGLQVGALVVLFAALSNLAILNQYLAQAISSGPTWNWSDATERLADRIKTMPDRRIFAADWGISTPIDYYTGHQANIDRRGDGAVVSLDSPHSKNLLRYALAEPSYVFITHGEGREAFPDIRKKLAGFAAQEGYSARSLGVITDRHGSAVYEIFEFKK